MEFNANKCSVMELGKSKRRLTTPYTMGDVEIKKTKEEKDLGITISDNLSPEKHVNNIVGATYELLRKMKRAFNYMDEELTDEKANKIYDSTQTGIRLYYLVTS